MSPIKYKEEIRHLLKSVQKQKVAVMHCETYQFGNPSVNTGNWLADKTAEEVVGKGIIVLKPRNHSVSEQKSTYSHQDRQLVRL